MAPRRRNNTGFIGVRLRLAGHFAAEITAGGTRVWLGTFYTKEAAARAYDVAAWRFGAAPRNELPEVVSTKLESLYRAATSLTGEARRYRAGQRRIDTTEATSVHGTRQRPSRRRRGNARIPEGEAYDRERERKLQRKAEVEGRYAKGEASTRRE
ncbi:hypothetical protein QYE76_036523 [Lolium multiflorum]|uniref:AP2/ERF domain-containing protein n=1 Tax=Lolium multiflorum TaxID=4521 RepID=A0AAD8R2L5_LOLMU|nr:hypothetical protein QYE76_036523 [Lolium multiflorum]